MKLQYDLYYVKRLSFAHRYEHSGADGASDVARGRGAVMASSQQGQETRMRHVLSFDVEEHFQVSAFWSDARRQQWDRLESRVEQNTLRLAELLAQL